MRFVERPVGSHEQRKDPELLPKLALEASGILAWLVRGALAWQREGLNPPDEVLLATEAYRREEDQLEQFITDRCILHPQASITGSVLFNEYISWGKENNMHSLLNGTQFGRSINKRSGVYKNHRKRGTQYQGIALNSEDTMLFAEEDPEPGDSRVIALLPNPSPVGTGSTGQFTADKTPMVTAVTGFSQDSSKQYSQDELTSLSSRENNKKNPPPLSPLSPISADSTTPPPTVPARDHADFDPFTDKEDETNGSLWDEKGVQASSKADDDRGHDFYNS